MRPLLALTLACGQTVAAAMHWRRILKYAAFERRWRADLLMGSGYRRPSGIKTTAVIETVLAAALWWIALRSALS